MHHILLMEPNPQQDTHDPGSVHPVPQVKAHLSHADNDVGPLDSSPSQRRGLRTWALAGLVGLGGVLTIAWVLLLVYQLIRVVVWLFT
jgi:hypothetical protein